MLGLCVYKSDCLKKFCVLNFVNTGLYEKFLSNSFSGMIQYRHIDELL